MKDLNYLLYRQQIERSRSCSSACPEARAAHEQLAGLYEAEIERMTEGRLVFVPTGQRSRVSATARSSIALMLKKGSVGSAGQSTVWNPTASAKPLSDRLPVPR